MNKYKYRHFDRASNSLSFKFDIFSNDRSFPTLTELIKEAFEKFRKN